jgi:hypothetical protein
MWVRVLYYCGSEKGQVAISCDQENEILGAEDAGNFLTQRNYYFLMKDSALWIYLFIYVMSQ